MAPVTAAFGLRAVLPACLDGPTTRQAMEDGWLDAEFGDDGTVEKDSELINRQRLGVWEQVLEKARKAEWAAQRAHEEAGGHTQRWTVGEYVMLRNAEAAAMAAAEEANRKLLIDLWNGPWRVGRVIGGVTLVLTRADDPLIRTAATIGRCKRVQLTADELHTFERLYQDALEAGKKEKEELRQLGESGRISPGK